MVFVNLFYSNLVVILIYLLSNFDVPVDILDLKIILMIGRLILFNFFDEM